MNREIKFRALENGKMFSWKEMIDRSQGAGSEGISIDYPMYMLNDDSIIWMQYTGLKDKNGKEIYEGDILRCHEYDSSDTGHRITQTFNNAVVGFHYGNFYYHPNGNMKAPHQLLMYAYQAEVIGNIYSNPELLNK